MSSDYRNEIIDFINTVYGNHPISFSHRASNGRPLDIYFPDLDRAIVFHSIKDPKGNDSFIVGDDYQENSKIRIVHLWEDQWVFHERKIRSKLKSLLGITERIHGRETKLISINNSQLVQFLATNHLHVPIKAKYKYGLVKDNELVAVMSFSKSRKIVRDDVVFNSFELLRFCNKLDATVVGGFSKLLQYFLKTHNPDDVMTYVDRDWSNGQYLIDNEFEFLEGLPAMEFWLNIITGEREYPHLVLKKLGMSVEDIESEPERKSFLIKNSYAQVFNSGSYKLILKRK